MDTGQNCYEVLKEQWNKRHSEWKQAPGTKTSPWTLVASIYGAHKTILILYVILSVLSSVVEFANTYIIKLALETLENQPEDLTLLEKLKSTGKLIFLLLFSQVALAIFSAQNTFIVNLLSERVKHGINGLIFDKVMKKSIQRDPVFSIGEITNMMQVDVERIASMSSYLSRMVVTPIELIAGLTWIYILVGRVVFLGIFILLISFCICYIIMKRYQIS